MATAQEFLSTIDALMEEGAVAGISVTSQYDSLSGMTVTPPAGTIRQEGEVVGFFETSKGKKAATIDTWGSQASRCEALLASRFRGGTSTLAEVVGFPLVVLVDEEGEVLTTSVELSHRQADATMPPVPSRMPCSLDSLQRSPSGGGTRRRSAPRRLLMTLTREGKKVGARMLVS